MSKVKLSQIANGILVYAEKELLPMMDGANKIFAGAALAAAYLNAESLIAAYLQSNKFVADAITVLFSDENGMIDIDAAIEALKESLRKNGRNGALELDLPLIGKTEFSENDLDKMRGHIRSLDA